MADDVKVNVQWNMPTVNRVVVAPIMKRTLDRCIAEAKYLAPVKTGRMRDSINGTQDSNNNVLLTCSDPKYAFFAFGTREHDIEPNNAGALVFTARDGSLVKTLYVHHPGQRANPFLKTAVANVISRGQF